MEKLLELLNKYEKEVKKSEFYEWEKWTWWDTNLFRRDTRDDEGSHIYSTTADTYVISKKYEFIKRLVENDKIDYRKLDPKRNDSIPTRYYLWTYIRYPFEDEVIMTLAIQDEPIKFLISILKNV